MTNLTSEQYRDVIKNVQDYTMEVPNVQQLLRRAVETFFKRFGAYPEMAGVAPGKIGLLGEQTQFSDGLALPTATPMATIIVGRRAHGSRFTVVTSADVGKPHKVKFSFSCNRPLAPGCPEWLNYVKGVIDNYKEDVVPPFEAAIESSVPMGVGFGSSSAIEVATYSFLEVLVGKKSDPIEKAKACQNAERQFAMKEVGLVDRITSILAKDRHAMLIDCKSNEVQWIPFRNPKVAFVAIDSHVKDTLFGDEYPERSKYLSKACEILQVETLRDCTEDDLLELENRVNEILEGQKPTEEEDEEEEEEEGEKEEEAANTDIWPKEEYDIMIKRARFFITEMKRITEAMEAWNEGDVQTFGEKLKESHKSLMDDFDFYNPLLDFLVNTSLEVEGVLGSRMTGMGLGYGGGIISVMNKENVEKYCSFITEKFAEFQGKIATELQEGRMAEKQRRFEIKKRFHSEHFNPSIASSERIGLVQDLLENGEVMLAVSPKKQSLEDENVCERKRIPCIVKVEKKKGGCGTWARHDKERDKDQFLRKISESLEESEFGNGREETSENGSSSSAASSVSEVKLEQPTFYLVSPFAGARMMFVTKTDLLRNRFASPVPEPKSLVRSALQEFTTSYGNKPEAVGLAPATVTLFGEFMEYHLGYIICMALPMMLVVVGGRNDTVWLSVKTTSKEVEEPPEMKIPVPCVRRLKLESRSWVNYISGTMSEFKGGVPGFNAVINSSVPIEIGVNSCAALQASVYTFLENLTGEITEDPFEKADRCGRSEFSFLPTPVELVTRCSSIKFFPAFLSKEGYVMFINCRRYKISHYFFDHPSYVFIIASCKKNDTQVTTKNLDERLLQCEKAVEILEKQSLLSVDMKHLRCLRKRDATEEIIKRVRYVITEHERTKQAVKAIRDEDYKRFGLLMNQSHASLRDDYEVSSPQIESLVSLAMKVEGVLGVKMLGKGLSASVIILVQIADAEKCMRYMRKNYKPKNDKPVFYITKPSRGAFAMNPDTEVPLIP